MDLSRQFKDQGFVIIRNSIPAELLSQLQEAARHCIHRGKSNEWPHTRVHPQHGLWGLNQVCNPSHNPEHAALFLRYLVLMMKYVSILDNSSPEEFQLELCNLLTDPKTDFVQDLHRDHVTSDLIGEAELLEISNQRKNRGGYQWNTALEDDDDCLAFIPGSHSRPRLPEELEILRREGPKTSSLGDIITLNKGDTVLYDANGLHRGRYLVTSHRNKDPGWRRSTLHYCVGHAAKHGVRRIPMMRIFDAISYIKSESFEKLIDNFSNEGSEENSLLLIRRMVRNLLESEERARQELGEVQLQAAVDAHNNRSDVKGDGLVGEKQSKL